jgi:hypothetical protein
MERGRRLFVRLCRGMVGLRYDGRGKGKGWSCGSDLSFIPTII